MNAYIFKIKIGRRIIQCERFGANLEQAIETANRAMRETYCNKPVRITGVREMTAAETVALRSHGITPTF